MGHHAVNHLRSDANMEESSVESPTVIPSEPPVPLKSYPNEACDSQDEESERQSAKTYPDNDVYG